MNQRSLIRFCGVALSGLLFLASGPASRGAPAEPAGEPGAKPAGEPGAKPEVSEADKKKAKGLFAKGTGLYQAAKYKEAIAIFDQAYVLWPNPRIQLNIAICHLESGDTLMAVRVLRKTLRGLPAEKRQDFRTKLPPKLVQADKEAGELVVRMPGDGVEVSVDGRKEGTAPVTVVVLPGEHQVVVTQEGEQKASKTVVVKAGARETWELTAWPSAATPDPTPKPSKPGLFAGLKKLQRLPIWYFGAAAVLALAGGVSVIGMGVKTNKLEDDYVASPSLDARNEGIRYRNATNAMIGVTVTAAVAAGVLALFTDWKNPFRKKERALRIVPQLGPRGSGLAVSGSF